ncbi:MAG: glycosyl hydrolase 108 family protein [Phenylobacterium sp.]
MQRGTSRGASHGTEASHGGWAPGSANEAFDKAFEALALREGGLLIDPRDVIPGDLAIDPSLEAAFPRSVPLHRRLSASQARSLYHRHCWIPARCDQLPAVLAIEVFDMAAASGVDAALGALRVALRLAPGDRLGVRLSRAVQTLDPVELKRRFIVARLCQAHPAETSRRTEPTSDRTQPVAQ